MKARSRGRSTSTMASSPIPSPSDCRTTIERRSSRGPPPPRIPPGTAFRGVIALLALRRFRRNTFLQRILHRARFRAPVLCFPVLILGVVSRSRDQVGQSGNGVLGIAALGFESQRRSALGGETHQAQDAPAVGYDALAVDPDIGLERIRQFHESAGNSEMQPQDVVDPDLATGELNVLSHRN